MELTPYINALRQELAAAAAAGGDDARALAERLTAPLESAARLALLEALAAAASEITQDLAPGSVDLRLRGREPSFVVTPPPPERSFGEDEPSMISTPPPVSADADEGATARINFRLSEHLKGRVEEAAGKAGLSVNSWLIRATSAALDSDGRNYRSRWIGQSYNGWVR